MRRCLAAFAVAVAMLALAGPPLRAEEGPEAQDLAKGREALIRREYAQAVEYLHRGVLALDPTLDAATIADAWLQIGIAYLNGLDHPEEALPAFIASAGSAVDPATAWLWASVTAEKLGRTEEALIYRARALSPQATAPTMEMPAPAPAPEPAPTPASPAPAPAQAEPEPEKPDAVQHFFGPEAVEEPTPEAKPAEPARAEERKEKVDAFEHFFGAKDEPKEEGEGESESEEKPPGA